MMLARSLKLRHRNDELVARVSDEKEKAELLNDELKQEIRQREETEAALRQSQEQLVQSQKMEAVGQLAGGIAHDFNNLLTVILGYADGLLRRFDDDDPVRRRVEAIHRAGTHAAELTKELLTISRHQVVSPVVVEPAVFVNDIGGMLERILGDDVTLAVRASEKSLAVRIDPMQLEQVLLNLAANARDAMPVGGTLTIDISAARGESDTAMQADRVAITVTDTGMGMDADTLEHCLEPFFTTKQAGRGTGLGLAAVHGIVDQSGGELRVSSKVGAGTSVAIMLPAVTEAPTEPDVIRLPTPRDPVESRYGTVLVVDDDLDIRSLVATILRDRGYSVLLAHSGPAALQLAAEYQGALDLMLTDVAMPAMSGVELAQRFRAATDVPVLFMSGFAEEVGIGQLAAGLGAGFVAKPFTPEDLVRQVERAIDGADWIQLSKR
jgi:signal transduction histidine kinase/ActR/RegA family two-component response regulator